MKKISFIILALSLFTSLAQAMPEEATFGVAENSQEWKQAEIEEWLIWRMNKDISQFVSPEHFKVYADVTFKNAQNSIRRVSNVELSMFGTVATVVQADPPKPHQGMFGKIARLNLTLVVDKKIDKNTVEAMKTVMRQKVPVVPQEKIYISEVKMGAPAMGFVGWFRELKTLFTALVLLLVFGWGVKSVLREIRIQGGIKVVPHPANVSVAVAKHGAAHEESDSAHSLMVPMELVAGAEMASDAPKHHGEEVVNYSNEERLPGLEDSLVAKTERVAELRQMRSLLLTMTISECTELVQSEKEWGAIALTVLPKEKVARVLNKLPDSYRKEIGLKALHWSPEKLKGRLNELQLVVSKYKGVDPRHHTSQKIAVFVEQVGIEKENEVFDDMIQTEQYHRLAEVVRHSPPYEIIRHVPSQFQIAALSRVTHADRVDLLANGPDFLRVLKPGYLATLKGEARKQFEAEISTAQVESSGLLEGKSLTNYVNVLRSAFRENWEIKKHLHGQIETWLAKKTNNVIGGSGHGKVA